MYMYFIYFSDILCIDGLICVYTAYPPFVSTLCRVLLVTCVSIFQFTSYLTIPNSISISQMYMYFIYFSDILCIDALICVYTAYPPFISTLCRVLLVTCVSIFQFTSYLTIPNSISISQMYKYFIYFSDILCIDGLICVYTAYPPFISTLCRVLLVTCVSIFQFTSYLTIPNSISISQMYMYFIYFSDILCIDALICVYIAYPPFVSTLCRVLLVTCVSIFQFTSYLTILNSISISQMYMYFIYFSDILCIDALICVDTAYPPFISTQWQKSQIRSFSWRHGKHVGVWNTRKPSRKYQTPNWKI